MRCATHRLLLAELGLKAGQVRELQSVPMARLLAANAAVIDKMTERAPGWTANSPMVDGKAMPGHPWDPAAPALSATIPLLIGYARTEETLYDRPTPEKLALDEAGLRQRVGGAPRRRSGAVIDAYRKAHPEATPWDLLHPDRHRSSARHLLARAREAQSRSGGGARVPLSVRLGNAGGRRAHAVAAHHRNSVRLQQHRARRPAHLQDGPMPTRSPRR